MIDIGLYVMINYLRKMNAKKEDDPGEVQKKAGSPSITLSSNGAQTALPMLRQ